ncbi:MAG: CHRD domain-containing protein [Acidobacteria bacterium]|nr:CHRD domain-containing protein [Acidobacteriota bacterium]
MFRVLAFSTAALLLPSLGLAQATTQTATVNLTADLQGSNENPAVETDNSGNFTVSMVFDIDAEDDGTFENIGEAVQSGLDSFLGLVGAGDDTDNEDDPMPGGLTVERNDIQKVTVSVRGDFDKPTGSANQTITGFHIHKGGSSENGDVVVNFNVMDMAAAAGSTRISRSVTLTTSMEVDTAVEIARNPSAYYLNLHTSENQSGEIRGQLQRSADDQNRQLRGEITMLSRQLSELRADLSELISFTQDISSEARVMQFNRIDSNVAAIGRRVGLNTDSEEVVGSAR